MKFESRLTGEAATLARTHRDALERLPATFHASILVELEKWATLFPAEHAYQRTLIEHLGRLPAAEATALFAALLQVEREAGCDRVKARTPGAFQDEAQAALRKLRLLGRWRQEVDAVFRAIQPAIDGRLHPAGGPRRLVVQVYGSGISIQADQLWRRFQTAGVRAPLTLGGVRGSEGFLAALFGSASQGAAPKTLLGNVTAATGSPIDAWAVETGTALDACCASSAAPGHTSLSYERLRTFRGELTRALFEKIQAGVESPQAFAAYARSLRIAPGPGVALGDEVVQAFVRDVFLTGNGTLFVNNTFVEWAAVQALRRAQPRVLAVRYGVRDKMKPFSSLLLFSQPRASDQIPDIEDPTGSFVDVEQLSFYVWLSAEKTSAYRDRTLYVFAAEGVDDVLLLRSDARDTARKTLPPVNLADVSATMAAWLGVASPREQARPIDAILS
jgi:hypothetical protein